MSIGTILNIAQSGLDASQVAIQTTSHNIANVDTPGYTEQETVLEEARPIPTAVGLMGDGVTVTQIQSYIDQNLQNAINSKNSDVQEQQTYETNLTQIQSIFNEDNSQLSAGMTTFFNDWSTLSTDPTSTADKQAVASDGQTLCATFNTMYGDLGSLQSNLNGEVNSQIDNINTATSKIASLNQLIAENQKGTSEASDYVDQRNQLVQQLAGYMNISTFTDTSNMVHVLTSNGSTLVDGVRSYQLTVDTNPKDSPDGLTQVGWQGPSGQVADITSQISGGSLGALLTTRDTTIPDYMSNLNGLAQSIMQNVNYFHEQGNDNAGIPFFQCTTANYAQGISLASQIENASGEVQTQNVMASSSTANPTDNDVATAIASLANDTVLGGSTITSQTFTSPSTALNLSGLLVVNGVGVDVGPDDTLQDIATSITNSGAGVSAGIASAAGGSQLVLTASGSADNISVVNGDLDTPSQSLLQTLTTTPVSSTGEAMNLMGTIQLGHGKSVPVADSDTLTDVETNINADTAATGISANISTDSSGSVLVLTGSSGNISISSGTVTGTLGLAGAAYTDYEAGVVANVGQATESATNLADYNQSALTSLQQQQSQESGVSIDDEMSNLIKFQNAYQAAARIFTVAQQMVDTLLSAAGVTTS